MTDSFFTREISHAPNHSVQYAIYLRLRRQPWKAMAIKTWHTIKHLFLLSIVMAAMAATLSVPAHARTRTYEVLTADVPFKFHIGDRTFRPGHYDFVIVGNGLLAMRDAHQHFVASLVTRSVDAGEPSSTTKLVFINRKKDHRLAEIRIQNSSQALEVVSEELAVAKPPSLSTSPAIDPFFSFADRSGGPHFKH